jgi:hypothetical protein
MFTPSFSASRRGFLRGLGGVTLGLPALEALAPPAWAAASPNPAYTVFVRQANGVAQADNGESEQYWPRSTGAISPTSLAADSDRATSELARWADRMLLVKGTNFAFEGNGCGHSGGGNQVLTAASISTYPEGNRSLAMGESVDNYIAKAHPNNGGEPLTLYTGPRYGYLEEVLSYRGSMELRSAEDDPYDAYIRMMGGDQVGALLDEQRVSVNDLVRDQMADLLRRSDLSSTDRRRLELHRDSIRDFERLSCLLAADEEQAMADLAGQGTLNDNRMTVARMHMDLIALAFLCDFARAATLQIGDGNDATEYTVDGQRLPSFHQVSHRIYGDGDEGDPIVGAVDMHHGIDRLFLQQFDHLLTRLEGYGLLDQSIAVHTNDLGTPTHGYRDIPWVIVGGGGGFLKQGQFVDVGGVTHNQLLSTLINAAGLRNGSGGYVDDFGDASLASGVLSELIA